MKLVNLVLVLTLSWIPAAGLFAQMPSPGVVERFVDRPTAVRELAPGHWWIDFGVAAFGNVEVAAAAPGSEGRVLRIKMGEAKRGEEWAVDPKPTGTVRYQEHEVALKAGEAVRPELTWAPPGWMKEGWLELPAGAGQMMPFRFVEIENAAPDFDALKSVVRVGWRVPFDDSAAEFSSSSPELDAVWALCKHSIKATTFMGVYVDGDRERKPYEADALLNQLSHYVLDAHYTTARLTNDYLIQYPTWPTEWQLQTAMLIWNDFLWSGDVASLKKHYDVIVERAMIGRRTADGLFLGFDDKQMRDIVDWPSGERDGYDMKLDVKTAVTAFHFKALRLLTAMAQELGRTDDAARFATLADQTFAAVNARLWDEARGCYWDGLDSTSGQVSEHASAHATFFALALGLVPEERVARATSAIADRGMVCSVYGAQFLIEALYDGGASQAGFDLLTSRGNRSWLNMVERVGSTITLEAWDPEFKPNLDWNHAWGAAPANLIPRKIMGIEPLLPGFTRFAVRPQTTGLTHARVKMPTPHGPILLAVRGESAADWTATLEVPEGCVAEFTLPFAGEPVVSPSGRASSVQADGRAQVELPAGTWTLSIAP